jgi:multidrug efflux pump subunit AcrA (membrane-fusion protein)
MRQRIGLLVILLLLLALAGGAYWYLSRHPQVWDGLLVQAKLATPKAEETAISASGFIEVRQVSVAPEVSGRIARLAVDEGDAVLQGDVLVEIDTDLLDAQIVEAQAAVAMAQAQLDRVAAGARAEEIAVAEAGLAVAEAQRDAAYQAWQDAILLRDNPQELDLQIAAVRSRLPSLEHRLEQMVALKDAAELVNPLREQQVGIIEEGITKSIIIPGVGKKTVHFEFPEGDKRQAWATWNLASTDVWQAWVSLNQVVAARDATQRELEDLLAVRNNPQQAAVQVARAEAEYRQALAGVAVARANLQKVRAGATQEQIDVARSGVEIATRLVDSLRVQREKYTLVAPLDGMVLDRPAHEGENAVPGTSLLSLGNLDAVELTIYVPEPQVGRVQLDQTAAVSVDSFPGETFAGRVVWISDEAEFTPKNIQTREERINTVFAVKISIPNPDHRLKPGMPADAVTGASLP